MYLQSASRATASSALTVVAACREKPCAAAQSPLGCSRSRNAAEVRGRELGPHPGKQPKLQSLRRAVREDSSGGAALARVLHSLYRLPTFVSRGVQASGAVSL